MNVTDVLTREEIAALHRKSDLRGLWSIAVNWGLIAAALALVAWRLHPLTVIPSLVLLGNRQLGLAVLMHDCGHRALFRTRALNRWIGSWLCAAPVISDLDAYMKKHAKHHVSAGSEDDPDLDNYRPYAVSKASFRRKILRDLAGRTGVRTLVRIWRGGGARLFVRPLIANAVLLAVLWALGRPWLWLLWMGAWLTTNMLFARIRQAAEHAVVPDLFDPDPRKHTRTTLPRLWERLTLAPNHVNFHLEHHLLPTVPPYRLPAMHRMLRDRGFYGEAEIVDGYRTVLAKLTVS